MVLHDKFKRQGQASIELMAALVLLILVIGGLLHVNKLVRTSLFLHSTIRGIAGEKAMSSMALGESPDYIKDWEEGKDGIAYTPDDVKHKGGSSLATAVALFSAYSTENHAEGDWAYVEPHTLLPVSFIQLRTRGSMSALLSAVHTEESLSVPVEPIVRELVYDKEEIEVKEGVWMPLMGGLF